ncbi:hypothetical protein MSAN_00350200 [Mycena sanguinolenta]|uniref:DUF6533 domain-containing protein n=1 Tax=Mycena sanguinolenta TaxID=230812 RepID=A0A8H7DJJ3_9AGAR|nr:hypothetical protein MSAN_00350200 [Mycena sanguinolenta]
MSNFTSDPAALADELESLYNGMAITRMENCAQIASITFLIYDILLKFDQEFEYVWRSKMSLIKFLYFFARYYGVLYNISIFIVTNMVGLSLDFCSKWFWFVILGGDILFTSMVNIILVLRINAMYFRNPKVFAFLIALLVVQFSLELYSSVDIAIITAKSVFLAPLGLPWPGCFSFPNVRISLFSWVPDAIIATVFFLMTVATFFRNTSWTSSDFKSIKRMSPLLVSFVKDGMIFYFFIFAILMTDMFMDLLFKNSFANFLGGWLIAIYSIAATRLILNLRETSQLPLEESVMLHTMNASTTYTGDIGQRNAATVSTGSVVFAEF